MLKKIIKIITGSSSKSMNWVKNNAKNEDIDVTVLFVWYFIAGVFIFIGKTTENYNLVGKTLTLPIIVSFIVSYYIIYPFIRKKHPNIRKEHMLFYTRKQKLKNIKRKIFYKKLNIFKRSF